MHPHHEAIEDGLKDAIRNVLRGDSKLNGTLEEMVHEIYHALLSRIVMLPQDEFKKDTDEYISKLNVDDATKEQLKLVRDFQQSTTSENNRALRHQGEQATKALSTRNQNAGMALDAIQRVMKSKEPLTFLQALARIKVEAVSK